MAYLKQLNGNMYIYDMYGKDLVIWTKDINQALYLSHEVCINRLAELENLAGEKLVVVKPKIPFILEEKYAN